MNTLSISKFRAGLFAAVLAVAPLSPALHAQYAGMRAKVNVPFAFETAYEKQFSPGVYNISMENPNTLLIHGASEAGLVMTRVEDNGRAEKTGIAFFKKYGNQYFLSEITVAGKSGHLHFANSKRENRMQIAADRTAPTNVEVALLETAR